MTLNGTVFVQILNFIIAYLLLDRLLLRTVVSIIQKDRSERETLMKAIQVERDLVTQKTERKQHEWDEYSKKFADESPKPLEPRIARQPEKEKIQLSKISSSEIDELTGKLKDVLIKKASHVRL